MRRAIEKASIFLIYRYEQNGVENMKCFFVMSQMNMKSMLQTLEKRRYLLQTQQKLAKPSSTIEWEVELVSNLPEISKQMVEGATWFLLDAFSELLGGNNPAKHHDLDI